MGWRRRCKCKRTARQLLQLKGRSANAAELKDMSRAFTCLEAHAQWLLFQRPSRHRRRVLLVRVTLEWRIATFRFGAWQRRRLSLVLGRWRIGIAAQRAEAFLARRANERVRRQRSEALRAAMVEADKRLTALLVRYRARRFLSGDYRPIRKTTATITPVTTTFAAVTC